MVAVREMVTGGSWVSVWGGRRGGVGGVDAVRLHSHIQSLLLVAGRKMMAQLKTCVFLNAFLFVFFTLHKHSTAFIFFVLP